MFAKWVADSVCCLSLIAPEMLHSVTDHGELTAQLPNGTLLRLGGGGDLLLHLDFTKNCDTTERDAGRAPRRYAKRIKTYAQIVRVLYSPLEVLNDFLLSYIFG